MTKPHRQARFLGCLLFVAAAAGSALVSTACAPRPTRAPVDDAPEASLDEPRIPMDAFCRLAARTDLGQRIGDVVTTCNAWPDDWEESESFDGSGCEAHRIAADGSLVSLGVSDVQSAQRLSGDRLLLQHWNGSLELRNPDGHTVLIDRSASEPRVDSTGDRVVFIASGAGSRSQAGTEAGADRRVVRYDTTTGRATVLVHDAEASMPLPIPGLDDVLYVSTVTGIASLWLASLEGSPRQLTNVGYGADDSQLDPVYGDQVLWVDAYRIVFTASYASDVLWAFDVRTMSLVEVGPGAHPALGEHGELLSGGAFESETCTSYEIGGGA